MTDTAATAWHEAWVEAWASMPKVTKGRTAEIETKKGGYSYSYADLGDILDTVRPHLAQHGLAVAQSVVETPSGPGVITVVSHRDGHSESYGPTVVPAEGDARAHGSAITYARRYSLAAALGLATEDDDDGASAGSNRGALYPSDPAGACPSCGSSVWDNRSDHAKDPRKPAFKCSDKKCVGGGLRDKDDPSKGHWGWASWDATFFDSDVQDDGGGDVVDRMNRKVATHIIAGGEQDEVVAMDRAEAAVFEAATELGFGWPNQSLGKDELNAILELAKERGTDQ